MTRITLPLLVVFTLGFVSFADAQDQRRAQRRALVEDLLKGLIESQVEKQPASGQPDNRNNVRPNQPNLNSGRPVTIEVSRDMLTARQHLASWNQASGSLVAELRHHEYESPALRPLLADALKLQANVSTLSRKSQIYPTLDPLTADFQVIDRDWRVLSHRLSQTRGLPKECAGIIRSISDLDTQLCNVFHIQPQIDRRELQRLATKLQSDYDHLLQNVYYLSRGQQGGRELLVQGKQLQSMIAQASALIGQADYQTIVSAYKQCTTSWKGFSRQIQNLRDERLRHSMADIETTGRLIHEQLWLPVELDREYLGGMASTITLDMTRIFDSISMTQLLAAKQSGSILATAREFQNASRIFTNGISSGAAVEDLEWDFRLFEVQWNQMHDLFHDFRIPEVDHRLEAIEFSMDTLNQTFGEGVAMDPAMMAQLTANLDALFRQTTLDVHNRIDTRRYDRGFHDQICATADQLSQTASQLHQQVLRQPNTINSRADLNDLFVQWRTLKTMFNQCQEQDKIALNDYRRQIEPHMVKLQVVFAE